MLIFIEDLSPAIKNFGLCYHMEAALLVQASPQTSMLGCHHSRWHLTHMFHCRYQVEGPTCTAKTCVDQVNLQSLLTRLLQLVLLI